MKRFWIIILVLIFQAKGFCELTKSDEDKWLDELKASMQHLGKSIEALSERVMSGVKRQSKNAGESIDEGMEDLGEASQKTLKKSISNLADELKVLEKKLRKMSSPAATKNKTRQ